MFGDRDCWVFDLDGTLTIANHDFDAIRAELGIPEGHLILEYLATLPEQDAAPLHVQLEGIERRLAATVEGQEGCAELLLRLASSNCQLGILTRNTRMNAFASLERLGVIDLFHPDDVLGRDEAAPKPDPAGIQALLARWDASPERGVMVGDYRLDLAAGRAAGVRTVHVESAGQFAWPELTDLAVRSLTELQAEVERTLP